MESVKLELKPCPFCGSELVTIEPIEHFGKNRFAAYCSLCEAKGPACVNKSNAEILWNARLRYKSNDSNSRDAS